MPTSIPVNSPIVVTVTPSSPVAVPVNAITVGAINQPAVAYHHTQNTSSNTWTITHNLSFYPNVTVADSGGSIVEGEIAYTSTNALTIRFTASFSGQAYLS
jgi:hypothetical protein